MAHSCFNRIGRALESGCSHCGPPDSYCQEDDDVFRTPVRCEMFEWASDDLMRIIGRFRPRDLVAQMLEFTAKWEAMAQFALTVMGTKEEVGREKHSLQGTPASRRWRRGMAIWTSP